MERTKHIKSAAVKHLEELAFEEVKRRHPDFPYPVRPKYTDGTSNGLTKCVIDYIKLTGNHAERVGSTGFMKDNRQTCTDILGRQRTIGSSKWIKGSGQTGTSDVAATLAGRSVKIEIKNLISGDKVQSKAQKIYQDQVEAAGGVYLIVRTFEQFYEWYNEFLNLG